MLKKITIVVLSVLALFVSLFFMNGWHIDYVYADKSTVIEYKDGSPTISEPTAYVKGTYIFKEGFPIESEPLTKVNTAIVGEQVIEYKADFLWMSETSEQTIVVIDNVSPVIKLKEKADYQTEYGDKYIEEGYIAIDNVDGDITNYVEVSTEGNHIVYTVKDFSGNTTTVTREVEYVDTIAPTLTLQGKETVVIQKGKEYKEDGYVAVDKKDGDISNRVIVDNQVDINKKGTYEIHYVVSDEAGNKTEAVRKVVVEDKNAKTIYLTFDDGPSIHTEYLLDILKKYDVKATFFVVGNTSPEILKRIVDEGHAIGAHSLTHNYKKIYSSQEGYFNDLNAILDVIENATGVRTSLIRFPGGSSNTVSKGYNIGIMGNLAKAVNEKGFTYFDWNVSSGDAGETKDTETIFNNITKGIEQFNVPVVLQHDTKKYSIDAVENVILWAFEKGYEFDVLSPEYPIVKHKINN